MPNQKKNNKIRYAVVGLGHIAQDAILPAFKNAKQNSILTALVSGDSKKLKTLGRKYKVKHLYSYEQYDECLQSGNIDAVFIALPNEMHRSFSERAAKAGIHVLCEKPMAPYSTDCESMIQVAQEKQVKLMIAYRLHFEEANLKAIQIVQSGKIGQPRAFNAIFSTPVKNKGIRLNPREKGGGPLFDIGIYCLNAARYVFQEEPLEVSAIETRVNKKGFEKIEESMSVLLKFPEEKVASFTCTFDAAATGSFQVLGTKGDLFVANAFDYKGPKKHYLTIKEKTQAKIFKSRDQFAPELIYFSNCVLKNKDPEPSGVEGLTDVKIIEAIFEAAKTGKRVVLGNIKKSKRPSMKQEIYRPEAKPQSPLVNVENPSGQVAAP